MNTYTTTPSQVRGQTLTVMCPTPHTGVVVTRFNRTACLRLADGRTLRLGSDASPLVVVGERP